ncbi:hypothetical protein ACRALDRAFT_1079280 [Sodiomyces alcalophilus JCM 7366]|uniref:uncharacterized protein n=1 Tax=Sodiomyces alcalophilus JCM 7366 TaxID=591952 RepID=UPI0039B41BCC
MAISGNPMIRTIHYRNPYATHFNQYVDPPSKETRRDPSHDILGSRRHRLPNTSKNNPFNPSPDASGLPAAEADYLVYQIECYTAPPGPLVPRPRNRLRPIRFTLALVWRRQKRRFWEALAAMHALVVVAPMLLRCFAVVAWALLRSLGVRLATYVYTAWALPQAVQLWLASYVHTAWALPRTLHPRLAPHVHTAWASLQALHLRLAPYVRTAWAGTRGVRTTSFGMLLPRIGALYVLFWLFPTSIDQTRNFVRATHSPSLA